MSLKEYKLPKESFIGGWFIPTKICDELICYYNKFKSDAKPGYVNTCKENTIVTKVKDSIDLIINPENFDPEILNYKNTLQKVLNLYLKKYPESNQYDRFKFDRANIQKYPKKGGFKQWHFERGSHLISSRVLVFMTYLNNIKKGGTMFKYQKIITPSQKGLTLIWPTDFTHTHKSQIVNQEKIIITGWYSLI
jgi:prolyl 4-hydroxylase